MIKIAHYGNLSDNYKNLNHCEYLSIQILLPIMSIEIVSKIINCLFFYAKIKFSKNSIKDIYQFRYNLNSNINNIMFPLNNYIRNGEKPFGFEIDTQSFRRVIKIKSDFQDIDIKNNFYCIVNYP